MCFENKKEKDMIRTVIVVGLLVLSVFASVGQAQTANHQHPETVVDGSVHPELIPDSAALQHWLLVVSELPNAKPEDLSRQKAHLDRLQISELDQIRLKIILADFKAQYLSTVNEYNNAATTAQLRGNEPPSQADFMRKLDSLLDATKNTISLRLAPESASRVEAAVNEQKKRIKIHTIVHTMESGVRQ